jgi:hypothetical protein
VNSAAVCFLGSGVIGVVSNKVVGGFFIGESVVNASREGGGIDILSNEFANTPFGTELVFEWCRCFLLKGDVEVPTIGGVSIIDWRFPLEGRSGLLSEADDGARSLAAAVVSGTAELFFAGGGEGEVCEKGPSTSWCIVIGACAERVAAMVSGRSGGRTTAEGPHSVGRRVKKSRDQ